MQSSEYEDMYKSEDKLWWYVGLRDVIEFYTKKNLGNPHDMKILDAGCGTGKNMEFLKSKGYQVEGIDVSEEALDFCRKRGLANVKLGSVDKIPYKDCTFDAVLCMDVLGLLDKNAQKRAVSELVRVIKPGGLVILNSAALEMLRSQHDDVCNLKTRFSAKDIRQLFLPSKIELVKLSYRVFLLFPFIATIKIVKQLLKRVTKKSVTDQNLPISPLNWLLQKTQLLENRILRGINFPWGSSIFVVARKIA